MANATNKLSKQHVRCFIWCLELKLVVSLSMTYGLLIPFTSLVFVSMLDGKWGYVCHWRIAWPGTIVSMKWWYKAFYIIYALHKLLLQTVRQVVSYPFNRICPVKLFLNWCPIMVQSHMLLRTRNGCQPTPSPTKMDAFTSMGLWKSRQFFHIGKLETMVCSCSMKALKGFFLFIEDISWPSFFQIVVVADTIFLKCWLLSTAC